MFLTVAVGGQIGAWQGKEELLFDDIQQLSPTFLAASPRIFRIIFDQVNSQIENSSIIQKSLFTSALMESKINMIIGGSFIDDIWKRACFASVQKFLGGRIRLLFSGVSKISPDIARFMKTVFQCPLIQTYGQVETCFVAAMSPVEEMQRPLTVGIPLPSTFIKLVDIPHLGYLTTNNPPTGEICIKGPICFQEYYQNPTKTKAAIDKDGWFHTGDIGGWDSKGYLVFKGSFENLIELNGVEKRIIDPVKVEALYLKHRLVKSIMIHADDQRRFLSAIIIVEPSQLFLFLKEHDITSDAPIEVLVQDNNIRMLVTTKLNHWALQENLLSDFELFKDLVLDYIDFKANSLVSRTYQLKRDHIRKHYQTAMELVWRKRSSYMIKR